MNLRNGGVNSARAFHFAGVDLRSAALQRGASPAVTTQSESRGLPLHRLIVDRDRVVVGERVSPELRRCLNALVPFSWSEQSAVDVFPTAIHEIVEYLNGSLERPPHDLAERAFAAFASARGLIATAMVFPDLSPQGDNLIAQMTRGVLGHLLG